MSLYLIGDLQGCCEPLTRLLHTVDFSPSRDTLYVLGDLVNRGPDSGGVLRTLMRLGDAAQCVLGNHDLHLLAMWQGVRAPGRRDTAQQLLLDADASTLIDWLRHRAMALHTHGWLMVHAGVLPSWTVQTTLLLAREVETALRSPAPKEFFAAMYGNTPAQWHDGLRGAERLRVIVNALTRLRFCTPEGIMEFTSTESAGAAPTGYVPWFLVPSRVSASAPIAFGHWSTLSKGKKSDTLALQANTLALDTGCVWGGRLTAARLGTRPGTFELFSVQCPQAQPF